MKPAWLTTLAPSPWHLDKGQVRDKDDNVLASVPYTLNDCRYDANAVLLVTAPELLAACVAAYHELRIRCGYKPGYAMYDELAAVIAKAKGETTP